MDNVSDPNYVEYLRPLEGTGANLDACVTYVRQVQRHLTINTTQNNQSQQGLISCPQSIIPPNNGRSKSQNKKYSNKIKFNNYPPGAQIDLSQHTDESLMVYMSTKEWKRSVIGLGTILS